MKLRPEVKAYIEAELRDYHQTKKDLLEAKDDIAEEGSNLGSLLLDMKQIGIVSKSQNKINNPTEKKVMSILTNKRIRRMEDVIKAIEIVTGELPEEKLRMIELKYWQRPRRLTDTGIAQEIGCDRRTLYRWVDGIILAIAIEIGLAQNPKMSQRCHI